MNEDQFKQFKRELAALCAAHGVTLTASYHDSLQVWPIAIADEDEKQFTYLENKTKQ